MSTLLKMPVAARIFIFAVAISGSLATISGVLHWEMYRPAQFIAYLLIAVLASALKVNLPTITGTMSVNSLFILVSIVQLRVGETMVLGLIGVLIQCLWKPKSPVLPVRVLFSVTANAWAIAAAYFVFDQPYLAHNLEGIRVLATACTYFFVNTSLVALVVSLTEGKPVLQIWTACYVWCFPYYLGGAGIAWLSTFLNRSFDWQISVILLPIGYFVYRSYKTYTLRLEEEKAHVEEMAKLYLRTIEALALAIEAKDHVTHDHLRRVRVYALELGRRMGLNATELQSLRAAALLHDIGKLAVPEHIISKPGKLTPEEFEKMKIHPVVGAQILNQVQFPYEVSPIVLSHHEKWDGSGYPNGLAGDAIPLGARILSAVDALDALASNRQYRRALPLDEAMDIVEAESGKTFDPQVISLLRSCYVELERMAAEEPRTSARLNTEPYIPKGGAPATGFEQTGGIAPAVTRATHAEGEPLLCAAQARQAVQDLYEWTRAGDGTLSLQETLAVFASRLRDLLPYDAIAFYIRRGNQLVPEFVGGDNAKLFSSLRIPWGEGLSGWVAENCRPILNGNPSVEAGYLNDPWEFSTLRSALAVPLVTVSGATGVLALYRTERDGFSAGDLRTLNSASHRIALALEHTANRQPVTQMAKTVTNLPDAGQFFLHIAEEIERSSSGKRPFTLVICDLDDFAEVNRQFGVKTGNAILEVLANGLSTMFHSGQSVAHLGGDEFALLLPDISVEELTRSLENISSLVSVAGHQAPKPIALSHHIGVAHFPDDGEDSETLLTQAEIRIHRAKLASRLARERQGTPVSLDTVASAVKTQA